MSKLRTHFDIDDFVIYEYNIYQVVDVEYEDESITITPLNTEKYGKIVNESEVRPAALEDKVDFLLKNALRVNKTIDMISGISSTVRGPLK